MLEIAVISTSGAHLGRRYSKKFYLIQPKYLQCINAPNKQTNNLSEIFLVHVDLRSHVRIVHEKAGDTGIPVYAASTKLSQDMIPANYVPVDSNVLTSSPNTKSNSLNIR